MLTHVPHGQGGFERNLEPDPALKENTLRLGFGYNFVNQRNYCTSEKPLITLNDLVEQWKEITGRSPEGFIKGLKTLSKAQLNWTKARVTYTELKAYDLSHIAQIQREGRVPNIFDFATPEERRDIAQFLAREGVGSHLLDSFFTRDVLADARVFEEPAREAEDAHLPETSGPSKGKEKEPLLLKDDNKKEREPAGEREALDLNKRPRLELDLNLDPSHSLDEGGDIGEE